MWLKPPAGTLPLGAGWARKSWERESIKKAQVEIEDLMVAERNQCPNIENPMVLTGEPVHEAARIFWEDRYDVLMAGVPFRGWGGLTLGRKFSAVAKKARKEIPLLVVRQLKALNRAIALTDGSGPAESALGVMVRLSSILPKDLTLVGLSRDGHAGPESENLHLERGLAILREKGLEARGELASSLGPSGLTRELKSYDLLVKPFLKDDRYSFLNELLDEEIPGAVLFYIGKD